MDEFHQSSGPASGGENPNRTSILSSLCPGHRKFRRTKEELRKFRLWRLAYASRKLTDASAHHEFRRQDTLAEAHLRMMQTLEKHLHTGFADLFLMNADG